MSRRTELRNNQREMESFRSRLIITMGFVALLLFALVSRFFYLQVIKQSHFHTMAENNRIALVPIPPTRGQIVDRNGVILARNYSGYTLEIDPTRVTKLDETIAELGTLVTITAKDLRIFKKLRAETHNYASLPIRSRLTDEEAARFSAQQYRFPGVEVKARLFREYPFRDHSSHLIGYIGRINEKDLQSISSRDEEANYRGTDYIGKGGIEQSYEKELHGTTGFEEVEIDAAGHGVRTLSRTPPVPGNNLVLTLDTKLQNIAEQAFGEFRGALVAIDPNNGEVLAFVSKPGYDPNLFIDGIDNETWDALSNSPDVPLNNRILRGQYPAGSTVKPFMALAGLFYHVRTPERSISDPGYYILAGAQSHRYRDWKTGGHGSVDMFKAIQQSCDTYFYSLAVDLGIDRMHDYLDKFSFGRRTGIDLDGEAIALLPSEKWKRDRYNKKWFTGDTVSAGIGQGYMLVTPMQLAYAVSILANDGIAYRPHLLRQFQPNGKPALPVQTVTPADLHLDPDDVDEVKRAMIAVTQPGGTAAWAGSGAEYAIAGKTGTAQVIGIKQNERYIESQVAERNRDHAWFIAFAPADKPRIALAVLVENGGHGGTTAAPIARKVFDYYLLGKEPMAPSFRSEKGGAESD